MKLWILDYQEWDYEGEDCRKYFTSEEAAMVHHHQSVKLSYVSNTHQFYQADSNLLIEVDFSLPIGKQTLNEVWLDWEWRVDA